MVIPFSPVMGSTCHDIMTAMWMVDTLHGPQHWDATKAQQPPLGHSGWARSPQWMGTAFGSTAPHARRTRGGSRELSSERKGCVFFFSLEKAKVQGFSLAGGFAHEKAAELNATTKRTQVRVL